MDPVLTRPYSPCDVVDYYNYLGNGMPRHLYVIDDLLDDEGFKRQVSRPAVSFLLNGSIQSRFWLDFAMSKTLWFILKQVYKSELLTRLIAPIVVTFDSLFKALQMTYSSSICVYRKKLD